MNARARILGRLRAAGSRPASADFADLPEATAYYRAHRCDEDGAARLTRFRSAIEAAHAEVHDTDAAGWPDKLRELAAAKGVRRLLIGAGTPEATRIESLRSDAFVPVAYARPADEWKSELFEAIDGGLSRARSAIAATGSLVLWTGSQEPRLLSLVPPVHFVLLDADRIHADLHAALTAEGWSDQLPTNALLISGPSKTADIQQTLAYGAHGPRQLIVLLVHAGEGAP